MSRLVDIIRRLRAVKDLGVIVNFQDALSRELEIEEASAAIAAALEALVEQVDREEAIAVHDRDCSRVQDVTRAAECDCLDAAIRRWEELEAKATRGPWYACGEERGGCECTFVWARHPDVVLVKRYRCEDMEHVSEDEEKANAIFIAASKTAVPALIEEVKRLRAELDRRTA